jgi:hypothetical protein
MTCYRNYPCLLERYEGIYKKQKRLTFKSCRVDSMLRAESVSDDDATREITQDLDDFIYTFRRWSNSPVPRHLLMSYQI